MIKPFYFNPDNKLKAIIQLCAEKQNMGSIAYIYLVLLKHHKDLFIQQFGEPAYKQLEQKYEAMTWENINKKKKQKMEKQLKALKELGLTEEAIETFKDMTPEEQKQWIELIKTKAYNQQTEQQDTTILKLKKIEQFKETYKNEIQEYLETFQQWKEYLETKNTQLNPQNLNQKLKQLEPYLRQKLKENLLNWEDIFPNLLT